MHEHGGNLTAAAEKYRLSGEDIIDFSANINPLGLPRSVKKNIVRDLKNIVNYPEPQSHELRKELAGMLNLLDENILIGNGATELIYLIVAALKPERVLIPAPCFSEYERASKLVGARIRFIKSKKEESFKPDLEKIIRCLDGTDMLFVCNPCNPTGVTFDRDEIMYLLKECGKNKVTLVLDEVFIDFAEDAQYLTLLGETARFSNLLILRSLTKIYALPGLRIGYMAGGGKQIKKIAEYQYPWSVNSMAQLAAKTIIRDSGYVERARRYVFAEREYLFRALGKINGIKPFSPGANFIFCELGGKKISSGKLEEELGKKGILIRDCSNFRGLNDKYFRVAVKKRGENRKLVTALREVL